MGVLWEELLLILITRILKKVFEIIKENGLKINLERCNFFKEKVELLGHTLSIDGISPI